MVFDEPPLSSAFWPSSKTRRLKQKKRRTTKECSRPPINSEGPAAAPPRKLHPIAAALESAELVSAKERTCPAKSGNSSGLLASGCFCWHITRTDSGSFSSFRPISFTVESMSVTTAAWRVALPCLSHQPVCCEALMCNCNCKLQECKLQISNCKCSCTLQLHLHLNCQLPGD